MKSLQHSSVLSTITNVRLNCRTDIKHKKHKKNIKFYFHKTFRSYNCILKINKSVVKMEQEKSHFTEWVMTPQIMYIQKTTMNISDSSQCSDEHTKFYLFLTTALTGRYPDNGAKQSG